MTPPLPETTVKVLAFTPTYGDGPRPETLASVQAQVCAGQVSHEVSWENPYPGASQRNVLAQYLRGRELALAGGYDALWTVEHDMAVPPDALQLLWDTGAPVAYGVYLLRHGMLVLNTLEYLPGSANIGESLSLHRPRQNESRRQDVIPVSGVGMGCTLIRREVLEQLPFRSGGEGSEAPDIPFAMDCVRARVRQVAHFKVLCGHCDGNRWLWPWGDAEMLELTQVRANQNVTVRLAGQTVMLVAGQVYELPDRAELLELQRAGYVTLLVAGSKRR